MMSIEPRPLGDVGGCSPRKSLKFTCSEVASGGLWGPKMLEISYYTLAVQWIPKFWAFVISRNTTRLQRDTTQISAVQGSNTHTHTPPPAQG